MAFTIYPFIIATKWERQQKFLMNHEKIHLAQWKELFWIGFLFLYFGNSIFLLLRHLSFEKAYKLNVFEKEAYENESNLEYLKSRKNFTWWKRR